MTTPTTTEPAEYHRRIIAPTATAESLAQCLVEVLADIRRTYMPLIEQSLQAVQAGHGFEVAEQIIADIEYIAAPAAEWMRTEGVQDLQGFDGVYQVVAAIAEYGNVDEELNQRSPDRIADNIAHERWMCHKVGIDPSEVTR